MTLSRKRLIYEISQTAPKHEIAGLIEVLVVVRQSRISLMQEAFSKDVSVADAKIQLPDEPRVRSPSRSEVRQHEQHSRW
jgi:chromatin segregation and condensation protein Rec8/ScpA/Scc1 (kleisin family)